MIKYRFVEYLCSPCVLRFYACRAVPMHGDFRHTALPIASSDAPVSSRLRSARCDSIASGTNLLDHMSAQVADGGTCQSTSFSLASSGQAPFRPRMLYRQDDRQSRTDYQEPSVLLTLAFSAWGTENVGYSRHCK